VWKASESKNGCQPAMDVEALAPSIQGFKSLHRRLTSILILILLPHYSNPANYLIPQELYSRMYHPISDSINVMFNILRLAARITLLKLQSPSKLNCKPGYHLFYIALLTPGEDKYNLLRLFQIRPFRASIRKSYLTSL
jgi:hypothetical protein